MFGALKKKKDRTLILCKWCKDRQIKKILKLHHGDLVCSFPWYLLLLLSLQWPLSLLDQSLIC